MISIVGGKYRSRQLATPPSETTLPTKNMVRGAMMSILGDFSHASVLDLFAGSGALGIESLSRGAEKCVFVEKDKAAANVIESNLKSLREENGRLFRGDDKSALTKFKEEGLYFDIVFLDPPYAKKELYQEDVNLLFEYGLVDEKSRIMLEYEGELPFDKSPFGSAREYKYGKTRLLYIRKA